MVNDGGPAFPVPSYVNDSGETHESKPAGMSLRDYYRAHAPDLPETFWRIWMEGLTPKLLEAGLIEDSWFKNIANLQRGWRDVYADAMLAERPKRRRSRMNQVKETANGMG